MSIDKKISKAVDRIIVDLTCRCGFDNIWDNLDPDIQKEIKESWAELIREEVNKESD